MFPRLDLYALHTDLAQQITTAAIGSTVDDLDRDLSDVDDLARGLSYK